MDRLQTLLEVARTGSVTGAARSLHVSQSTVSKRLATLESEVGGPLLEAQGRGVMLTAAGDALVARTAPLLAELRAALSESHIDTAGSISVAVSESVLAAWGAAQLRTASEKVRGLRLELSAHTSLVAVELVQSGDAHLALCAGDLEAVDLVRLPLLDEPMVVVPSAGESVRLRRGNTVPVMSVAPASPTWRSLKPGLRQLEKERGIRFEVQQTIQSFASVLQLARAGFGHALVPIGVARAFGLSAREWVSVPRPGLVRSISIYARKRTLSRPIVDAFVNALNYRG